MSTFRKLWRELDALAAKLDEASAQTPTLTRDVHPELRASAANFIDYLALRQMDLRPLQFELERLGLSSLGRMEGHVRDALYQVRARVWEALRGEPAAPAAPAAVGVDFDCMQSEQILHQHTRALLGPRPPGRHIYAMITAPSAAEVDEPWLESLLKAGMNVLRVNGAHEGPDEWLHIVQTARRVALAQGVALRVLVDLPGPKLRTVAPKPGPAVVRWKPERDEFGRLRAPCQIALYPDDLPGVGASVPALGVPRATYAGLQPGDQLVFRDARGRRRRLAVTGLRAASLVANLRRTAYVVPETRIEHRRADVTLAAFAAGKVPARPWSLRLAVGDRFRLESLTGDSPVTSELPVVGCSLPQAVAALEPGARVIFDDGKIDCVVESCSAQGVTLRVTRAREGGAKLTEEKGINVPDTDLPLRGLTNADERALTFADEYADMIGVSFIKNRESVTSLYRRLERAKPSLGVVLKIETAAAFADLPNILLAGMARYPLGVMIARGDLAIEVGFQRLAEVQEELLWLCEAAQLPVIWATQVLASLVRDGAATRAEVTDAAMSVRAECVMLNKGPQIDAAVLTLVDIVRRMEHHQYKKRSLHRKLNLALPTPPTK